MVDLLRGTWTITSRRDSVREEEFPGLGTGEVREYVSKDKLGINIGKDMLDWEAEGSCWKGKMLLINKPILQITKSISLMVA